MDKLQQLFNRVLGLPKACVVQPRILEPLVDDWADLNLPAYLRRQGLVK
jgi:hypothetical protein